MAGSLKLVSVNKLIKLKYNVCEANWITNLSKLLLKENVNLNGLTFTEQYKMLKDISVEKDGHTYLTDMYTKAIVTSIISDKEWDKYHIHLNYDYIFLNFYKNGFKNVGNSLLKYSFHKPDEYKLLQEFTNEKGNLVSLVRIANKSKANWIVEELSKL
jgi:hypothetical protein